MSDSPERPTTASGIPVADNQNSLSARRGGPLLLQDFHPIEKLQRFNRERQLAHFDRADGAYGAGVRSARWRSAAKPGNRDRPRASRVRGWTGVSRTTRTPFVILFHRLSAARTHLTRHLSRSSDGIN